MNIQDNEEKNKGTARTDIDQTEGDTHEESTGETSTVRKTEKTSFSGTPKRKSTSLGSSHEPGTTPGREF
ncbi:hypothetical protein [Pedobacter sp. JCM 36344]|uniref:hypothetical protein n=1 Tax=Pedobacter sp. JCM 36344 TaxID=3374280 RepID=UPI00397D880B